MAKGTRLRDRVRRVFARASSSAGNTNSEDADRSKPGEKKSSKLSSRVSKPHQDMLAAWTFVNNDSRRRLSSQSMESPRGSRVHSRNASKESNIPKEERAIEEIEGNQRSSKTLCILAKNSLHLLTHTFVAEENRPPETRASEATLRGKDQSLYTSLKSAGG
ncbi:hypothetical protein GP486_004921 [Trichoglossum hirsutum]|uniref:Uncharacterized protein n=1 Tax=Trichoglossum hirsutum TaxID=265104 RepID=A0A9P8RN78_9PEZI|nr:hypothetical protein GP486_004921 [Trichoglossum hirsutum]